MTPTCSYLSLAQPSPLKRTHSSPAIIQKTKEVNPPSLIRSFSETDLKGRRSSKCLIQSQKKINVTAKRFRFSDIASFFSRIISKKTNSSSHIQHSFSFPEIIRKKPYIEDIEYPPYFSDKIPINPITVFRLGGLIPYPACTVSVEPNITGSLGTTPYIIAATPDPDSEKQKWLFYKMVEESKASLILSLCPQKTSPNKGIPKFEISKLTGLEKPVYQLVITRYKVLSSFGFALYCIRALKKIIDRYDISINPSHPIIVISPQGYGTGSFVMLFELLTQLEKVGDVDQFVGENFWNQALNMAIHIEDQSFPSSAFKWANSILGYLLRLDENTFQYLKDDECISELITIDEIENGKRLIHAEIRRLFHQYLKKRNQ